MLNPTVSVILPTFNRAVLLAQAMLSVCQQTFTEWDLWVIDDGSVDHTAQVVGQFTDPRIHYLKQNHQGVAVARNQGIAASKAPLVAFQDSDDTWARDKLEKQVQMMRADGDVAVVYSQFIRQKGRIETVFPTIKTFDQDNIFSALLWGNFITPQATLVRRQALHQVGGFDSQLPCLVDWDLWLRLSQQYKFSFIPEPLATVEATKGSISQNPADLALAMITIYARYISGSQTDKGLKAHHQYRIGHLLLMSGDTEQGTAYLKKAIDDQPWLIRYWPAWILANMGSKVYQSMYALKNMLWPDWY